MSFVSDIPLGAHKIVHQRIKLFCDLTNFAQATLHSLLLLFQQRCQLLRQQVKFFWFR